MLNFCIHSRSESSFSFPINTKHLFVYGNHEKNIKFNHNSFVNERKKLNFVLYSIPGSHRNKKPFNSKAQLLIKNVYVLQFHGSLNLFLKVIKRPFRRGVNFNYVRIIFLLNTAQRHRLMYKKSNSFAIYLLSVVSFFQITLSG